MQHVPNIFLNFIFHPGKSSMTDLYKTHHILEEKVNAYLQPVWHSSYDVEEESVRTEFKSMF